MYDTLLKSCVRVKDLETALGVRSAMSDREIALTESVAFWLIKCASKLGQWDVVFDVFREVQNEGLKPTMAVAFASEQTIEKCAPCVG
ncbi:hypothetical protein PI124_g21447 [Phytophthora idaei]|nr:hypothetical protein PI125_g23134 [Phytophthora idaei]KAG3128857.1 hypothetical protein PI126_g21201 [Phytophthora idaei]KAG3233477.1 hypothetical protein PI124_g21447 [Phytophthora idaei]